MVACPIKDTPSWKKVIKQTKDLKETYRQYVERGFDLDNQKVITLRTQITGLSKDLEQIYGVKTNEGKYKTWPENKFQGAVSKQVSINDELAGTNYRAVRYKSVSTNGQINWSIRIEPLYFQIDGIKTPVVDTQITNKIKEWLSKLNIEIKHFDTFAAEATDPRLKGAQGAADLLNKIIYVANGVEESTVLPEETAHFAIDLLGKDHPYVRRLNELIIYTDTYKSVKEEYKDIYKNENDFRSEAIGKLLANEIIKKKPDTDKTIGDTITRVLKKLWADFLSIFKTNDPQAFSREIDTILGKISNDILTGKDAGYKADNFDSLHEGFYYKLDTDIKSQQKILEDAIESDFKRLKILKARGKESYAEGQQEQLNKLENLFSKNQYKLGLYNFVRNSAKELRIVKNGINTLSTDDSIKEIARILRSAYSYVSSYSPILKDIRDSLLEEDPNNTLAKSISTIRADIAELEEYINDAAIPLLEKVLRPYAIKSDGSSINLRSALKILGKDISFTQRYLDAMAEADDDVLKITDKLVKDHKEKARLLTVEDIKDLVSGKKELETAGIASAKYVYEVAYDGSITGNLLSKFNRGQFEIDKKKFYEELNKKFTGDKNKAPELSSKDYRAYKARVAEWWRNHTQPVENMAEFMKNKENDFIEEHGKEEGTKRYNTWLHNNTGETYTSSGEVEIYYKRELITPNNDYINTAWLEIYDKSDNVLDNEISKAKDKFLSIIWNKKQKSDKKIPEKYRKPFLAPQVRKDTLERLTSSRNKLNEAGDIIKETFVRNEGDTDFGMRLTDEKGDPVSVLPVYFTGKISSNDLSLDIVSSMSAYSAMSNDYSEMNKIIDVLELESEVLKNRKVGNGQYGNVSYFGKAIPVVKPGEASFAYQRFIDYMKMVVYGEYKKDEGELIKGTGIDQAKTVDAFGKYVALTNMALNLYSGISNITFGSIQTRVEAAAKEYYSHGDLLYADKVYGHNLPGIVSDIGQRLASNKLSVWMEYANVLQDFESSIYEIDAERKTIASQLAKGSALFFTNKAGEHWMQTRTSLALANTIKFKDKDGKTINLWDASYVEEGRLRFKDGLTIIADGKTFTKKDDGKPFTQNEFIRFINKQNFINKRLHGIYNKVDRSTIQQYSIGRLAIMFRKFIKPGWNRRYAKLQYNYEGDVYTEGYYNTTFKFLNQMRKDILKAEYKLVAHWDQLQDFEKANMLRTATEAAYMIAVAAFMAVVTNLEGDDDNDWLLNMTAYQANRLYTELRFYSSPGEAIKILKSPAAGVDQLNKILNFLDFWQWGHTIERGKYKGYTNFEKSLMENIPLISTYNKFLSPKDQLEYFKK